MNWSGLGNLIGSALTSAGAAFVTGKQQGLTDEQAGIQAAINFVSAIVQHLRGAPVVHTPK